MPFQTSENMLREQGRLAEVDGQPTYSFAESAKNDLAVMLRCCEAETANYWRQPKGHRLSAAPFYFERAAILLRKQRRYAEELAVCEAWRSIIEDYQSQPSVQAGRMALAHKGPRSIKILERMDKAKALNQKQFNISSGQ